MVVRRAGRTDAQMRLGIDGIADRRQFAEHFAGVAVLQKRAVAAAPDAFDERRDVGVEPDAEAVLQDQRARFLVDEGAAAGREYHRLSGVQARDHAALAVAEMRLAAARDRKSTRLNSSH